MRKLSLLLLVAVLYPAAAMAQITVTAPTVPSTIKASDDFATRAFQDPWDMNQKTDVGAFLGSNDAGSSNWGVFSFTGGLFSGTTSTSDAQLWFLDTGNPLAAPVGKTGTNFPINADTYKIFAVRMSVANAQTQPQIITWQKTIYDSSPVSHFGGAIQPGTGIYFVDMDLFQPGGAAVNWTGLQRALRLQPSGLPGDQVTVDWARLVTAAGPNSCQPIRWTGGIGPDNVADVYLDTDTNFSNGFYGTVQKFATSASTGVNTTASRASAGCPVVSGAFNFHVGALPAGTYYAVVVPLNNTPTAGNSAYATAAWTVTPIPTLTFTSPSNEGSADDFATSQLGDPWDMDKVADVDQFGHVSSAQITTINMEAPDGTPLLNQRVLLATAEPGVTPCPDMSNVGDSQVVLLSNQFRGATRQIDPSRYRLLTVEFGIPNKPRDVQCGTIARVVWHGKGDGPSDFKVSDDILFNSRGGVNMLDKLTLDMATLNTEPRDHNTGPNPLWVNGATGGIDFFRFDPHEFTPATQFYVKRVKLADFERAKDTYVITWTYAGTSAGTVDLFYDLDGSGFDGTQIALGLNAAAGSHTWTLPAGLPTGSGGTAVYIYAIFRDTSIANGNENRAYAPLPIYADSDYRVRPRAVINRTSLYFGILANSATTTAPQTVRLSFAGPSTQTPCWTITNSNLNFQVSPSSGSGNATLTVSLVSQNWPGGGAGVATFTVTEGAACPGTMLNPGIQFSANYSIKSVGAEPIGVIDTPADGITNVTGSLGVTGWVIDDIDVLQVRLYRNAVAGESPDQLGRIPIGVASRVDDARPDVESQNPTAPFSYRAGWGYLMLTNFLPNLGNGTFVISAYAADVDGHETFIGQRTITVTNSSALEPFGAIDTPAQGETVSGVVNNFGWVLIKGTDVFASPALGGKVEVFIDAALVGFPGEWTARDDLTGFFPASEYAGINKALGVFTFNSATYQDGVHTISWVITATNGKAAGIGSRYFSTFNGTSNLTSSNELAAGFQPPPNSNLFAGLGRPARDVGRLDDRSSVRVSLGPVVRAATRPVLPDATGLRTVLGRPMDRVVIDASSPGASRYEAYMVANGTLRPLPVGASFDDQRGVLYWQPGLGFNGDYDFVVVRDDVEKVNVRVVLAPATSRPPVHRLVRNLFTVSN